MPNFSIKPSNNYIPTQKNKTIEYNRNKVPANYVNKDSRANINGSKSTGIAIKSNDCAKADYF